MEQIIRGQAPTLANYQLHLSAFEGPLDVLLRLVERSRLAIEDVSLVAVTDQFLAFVATMDETRPATLAEFAAVGARLTVLKSRSLLPRPAVDDAEIEQSDLTFQLREYKRVKDLARHLGQRHVTGLVAHAASHHTVISPARNGQLPPLRNYDAKVLVRSLKRRLTVVPRLPTVVRQRRVVSIREVIDRVASMLVRAPSLRFSHVVAPFATRSEVATAFLAVLVMVRRGSITTSQGHLFSDFQLEQGHGNGPEFETGIDEFIN